MEKKSEKKIPTSGPNLKILSFALVLVFAFVSVISINDVYGHGVGSETFPPVLLDGKLVTVEVSSSQSDPETNDDQQISISLIDFDSKITLRDVTFLIKSERGENFLFEKEFQADNGFLVFNFVSEDTSSIVIDEKQNGNFFGSLLGLDSRLIGVKGPQLSKGGLYKFDITILAADGYSKKLETPLVFNAGISIPQTTTHSFVDPNFDTQRIEVVTYYDEISNFEYDPTSKEIKYYMPFEWSEKNINQTSVVHQEIVIPNEFGDLLVSGFKMNVNGIELSEDIVNIDDFFSDERIVHFIIYQKELLKIFENTENPNGMNFVIKPNRDDVHLSSVTDNGQFRILVSWEPENLKSGSNAEISFDVTEIFLKNKPIATEYYFSVTQNERIIYEQNGISSDVKDVHNKAKFLIPKDVSGIVHVNFKNLDNNKLAKTTIPIVIDRIVLPGNSAVIPEWIRNNASWWSSGQIDDGTFIRGIEFLVKNEVILVSSEKQVQSESQEIPSWIRNNAGWWAEGSLDDATFLKGLEFLIENGVIRV